MRVQYKGEFYEVPGWTRYMGTSADQTVKAFYEEPEFLYGRWYGKTEASLVKLVGTNSSVKNYIESIEKIEVPETELPETEVQPDELTAAVTKNCIALIASGEDLNTSTSIYAPLARQMVMKKIEEMLK